MIYGVDAASYQGSPDWATVHSDGISFGLSKVTQGTGYVNPTWGHNKAGMLGLGSAFVPGGYHFLEEGPDPAAQARFFVDTVGSHMADLAVALDVEPEGSSNPTAHTARAWVAEFKKLTGGHPVIGYFPGWWWSQQGNPDLSFFDTLWQSRYVSGGGSASGLYGHVPASWWAAYGGRTVGILQFTDSANVAGISGGVDANAFKGSVADLRALALGGSAPTPTLGSQEDDMPFGQLADGPQAITPISLPRGRYKTVGFIADNGLQNLPPAQLRVAINQGAGNNWHVENLTVDSAKGQAVIVFPDPANTAGISVRREDGGAVHIAWEVS